jgi:hypothetical protein
MMRGFELARLSFVSGTMGEPTDQMRKLDDIRYMGGGIYFVRSTSTL